MSSELGEGTKLVEKVCFRTKDLDQATFMWCQPGAEVEALDGSASSKVVVYFNVSLPISEEEKNKLIMDYANGKTLVEPLQYKNKQSQLRDMLYRIINKDKV